MSDTDLEPIADDWSMIDAPEPVDLDPVAVNRKLRALGHAQRRLNEYDAAAMDELDELDGEYRAKRLEMEDRLMRGRVPLAASRDHLHTLLELVGRARIEADPGESTWTLPGGRLAVAGGGIEKEWGSDDDLLAWATKHCPDAVNDPKPATVDKNKVWAAIKDAAVKEEWGRQAPATDDGTVTLKGSTVPIRVKPKPRTVTPEPDLDAL